MRPPTALLTAAALTAGCAMDTAPPGAESHTISPDDPPYTVLANGGRWETTFAAPYDVPSYAEVACPNAWGCDVLITLALDETAPPGAVVPLELALLGAGRDDVREQVVLTHAPTAIAMHAEALPGATMHTYTLELTVLPGALPDDQGTIAIDARVAWQDIGFFRCGTACRVCTTSADCEGGAPCLADGICAQPGEPAPSCGACQTLGSGIADLSLVHRDELAAGDADCYEVGADDDPANDAERFSVRVEPTGADDSAYELRLYRDLASCAETRPLALARPHGRTQTVAWLESGADDDGTLLVQIIRRTGTAERAPYSVSFSPLE